jgi:hypothetical protein
MAQLVRRAQMRANVSKRIDRLVDEARLSAFVIGKRTRQPAEVRALNDKVRDTTLARRVQMWTTKGAVDAADDQTHVDHVVPVVVLVERILLGDTVADVFEQAVLCRLLRTEHRPTDGAPGLRVRFRIDHSELYAQMLTCPISELATLGWQRYETVDLWPVERLS